MEALKGKLVNKETLRVVLVIICEEFDLPPNAPGGIVRYRRALALSLFFKFFVYVAENIAGPVDGLLKQVQGITDKYGKEEVKCHQFYKLIEESNEKQAVGQPIPHKSGELHAAGEAVYVDDMVKANDELDLVFVISTRAHANILKVDPGKALQMEGVVDFISHKDLSPERNMTGLPGLIQDEEVFASETVHCVGQIIGAVIAVDRTTAERAAKEVIVLYEDLPAILTIRQAIEAQSFLMIIMYWKMAILGKPSLNVTILSRVRW